MKIIILSCVSLFIIFLVTTGCTKLVGGISKSTAAKNLDQYLQREYNGTLSYTELNRFFNAASMDPNMFSVVIYNIDKPEIEFYCQINLKNILINDTITNSGLDKTTINTLYLKEVDRYNTRETIKTYFEAEFSIIEFTTTSINLTLKNSVDAEQLQQLLTKFIERLNYFYKALDIYYDIALVIKTPENTEGFIEVPLEVNENKWSVESFLVSNKATNFKVIKKQIETRVKNDLAKSQPNFEICNLRKVFLDKNTLSRAAWIQYLNDKTIINEKNTKWQNPVKGLYVTYFDLETGHIYKGQLLTEDNDKITYEETLLLIKKALKTEAIIAW